MNNKINNSIRDINLKLRNACELIAGSVVYGIIKNLGEHGDIVDVVGKERGSRVVKIKADDKKDAIDKVNNAFESIDDDDLQEGGAYFARIIR